MKAAHSRSRRLAERTAASLFGGLILSISAIAVAQNPLELPDTSSPRATLDGFLSLTEESAVRYDAFRDDPSFGTQRALRQLVPKIEQLFDLSEIAPANRVKAATEAYYLLWDVMARLDLPNLIEIPDAAAVSASLETPEPITRWRIPGTAITIARVMDGPRSGEFLFSPDAVEQAPSYYEAMRDLPYVRPMPIQNVYRINQTITGWLIPPKWVEALPEWANATIAGQVLWKWLALLLLTVLAFAAGTACLRVGRRRYSNDPAYLLISLVRELSAPVLIWAIAELFWLLAVRQINVTGSAAALPDLLRTLTRGIAAVWFMWVFARWVAERIIASPNIPTNSLHANVIRFIARFIGFFAATVLLFKSAQQVGVPVYGLVAGAGVGGLTIALAVRSTLENLVGTLNIYADRPVRIGDTCRYGTDPLSKGTIEEIGLRSTRIRGEDRSITTIPNAEFANMHIVNLGMRDRFLMSKTIGLRYETTRDQLRLVLARLREMLLAHPRVVSEASRVQFVDFGPSALEISIHAYVMTSGKSEFLTIQEDLNLRTMQIVDEVGSAFAFPSSTVYQARDPGLDPDRQAAAAELVKEWDAAGAPPSQESGGGN